MNAPSFGPMRGKQFRCDACGVSTFVRDDAEAPAKCWACRGGPLKAIAELEWPAGGSRRITPITDEP
jgi:hypothetical protein